MPPLRSLVIGDDPAAWEQLGFTVSDGQIVLGRVAIQLVGTANGRGILGWTLEGVAHDIDGLLVMEYSHSGPRNFAAHHNGLFGIDRLMIWSDDLDRSSAAFSAAGLRERTREVVAHDDGSRSRGVFWAGRTVVEVVESPDNTSMHPGVSTFGGLSLVCDDFDRTAQVLGASLSPRRAARQAGRYLATVLSRNVDISVPVDVISPPPNAGIEHLAADARATQGQR